MSEEHLSDFALDALRIGAGEDGSRRHLELCAACAARMTELAGGDAAFAKEHDLAALADEALRRPRRPAAPRWIVGAAVALAASAALFFVQPEETRLKGGDAKVELFAVEAGEPRPVHGPVDPRAELAVRIDPKGRLFARLLWESAPGQIDALHPAREALPWPVSKPEWLSRKIILDGERQPERLVVVLCAEPFGHARALAEVRAQTECEVHTVQVTKR